MNLYPSPARYSFLKKKKKKINYGMLAVIFVQKAVPQTDRQISKNRPPRMNF